jgi:hypothetical protein
LVEWYPRGRAAVDDGSRRWARPATDGVAGRPGPQSVQQKRPGLRVAQELVPLGAEIPDRLPKREGEPQVARIPEGPPRLAGKRGHGTYSGESDSNGGDRGARLAKKI